MAESIRLIYRFDPAVSQYQYYFEMREGNLSLLAFFIALTKTLAYSIY